MRDRRDIWFAKLQEDLDEIVIHCPIVHAVLSSCRHRLIEGGLVSEREALLTMVRELFKENERLRDMLNRWAVEHPMPITIPVKEESDATGS